MLLTLDVGNTFFKCAVFEDNSILEKVVFEKENAIFELKKILKKFSSISTCVSSSVGKIGSEEKEFIKSQVSFIEIERDFPFPFVNKYSTPDTLGIDRIVLVSGASILYPKKNVLIIDAGTCITYDLLTDTNEYYGGAISPGIAIRYKSLNNYTAKLPLLEKETPNSYIGNSTNNAIHSGIVNGVLYEIDGFISQYQVNFQDLTIILTGGDADFLAKSLKSAIFANSNFLLESLNALFRYSKNTK
ncbi:MAG: type III pantothenate kinase [Flavobacterium sp.]|nr:type III pantothenate kinase [Flavobacterium sp.]